MTGQLLTLNFVNVLFQKSSWCIDEILCLVECGFHEIWLGGLIFSLSILSWT